MINNICVALSCSITAEYPIHDKAGRLSKLKSLVANAEYVKPTNVEVGECSKFQTQEYFTNKVPSGSSCALVIGRGMEVEG